LRYEIDKIRAIDPREEEFDELMTTKRQLSRLEKMQEAITHTEVIFAAEEAMEELYGLLERDGSYLSDALNQLRADMDAAAGLAEELAETDVEAVLDRLEALSGLTKRHGSIAEALAYLADKEAELSSFEHIEADKSTLEAAIAQHEKVLAEHAQALSRARRDQARKLEQIIGEYLAVLKLPPVRFAFEETELGETGIDRVDLVLEGSTTATLSGGEHNRLRLALMAAALQDVTPGQGVVILDEIDANVSGDESIAIAQMIADLSKVYQVFAISHQPHLSAQADQHILITRDQHSQADILDTEGRIHEIARIIGGEEADNEAVAFARKLMGV
jgi:DNA repair protein RecN (Recombination protein N)